MVLEHSRPVEPLGESPEAPARVRYGTSGIRCGKDQADGVTTPLRTEDGRSWTRTRDLLLIREAL
jgi:hypothetical protein